MYRLYCSCQQPLLKAANPLSSPPYYTMQAASSELQQRLAALFAGCPDEEGEELQREVLEAHQLALQAAEESCNLEGGQEKLGETSVVSGGQGAA